jgi:hypothetical protein
VYDEPAEWAGRGRPDWRANVGTDTRRIIASHRDTGEQRRIREIARLDKIAAFEEEDALHRRAQELLNPAPKPVEMTMAPLVGPERLALWLDIFQKMLAIVALLVLLVFGGVALKTGGWPVWFLSG